MLRRLSHSCLTLLLASPAQAVLSKCDSRLDCKESEVCLRGEYSLRSGNCGLCESIQDMAQCFPPCFLWTNETGGSVCKTDNLGLAVQLDLKAPYYFVEFGAGSKALAQMYFFSAVPKEEEFWKTVKRHVLQFAFVMLGVVSFCSDMHRHWTILHTDSLTTYGKLFGMLVTVSLSPNIASLLNAWAQFWFLGGKNKGNEGAKGDEVEGNENGDEGEASDRPKLPYLSGAADKMTRSVSGRGAEFGPILAIYAWALLIAYAIPTIVVLLFNAVAWVVWIWITIPLYFFMYWLAQLLSKLWTRIFTMKVFGKRKITELSEDLLGEDDDAAGVRHYWQGLWWYYFMALLMVPVAQFYTVALARLFDDFGYVQAVYMTITERHLGAFLATIQANVQHGINQAMCMFI